MHAWRRESEGAESSVPVVQADETALQATIQWPEDAAELLFAHMQRHVGDAQPAHHVAWTTKCWVHQESMSKRRSKRLQLPRKSPPV
jgi:hypothetical protein